MKKDLSGGRMPYARPVAVMAKRVRKDQIYPDGICWLQKVGCPLCGSIHEHGHTGGTVGGSPRVRHCADEEHMWPHKRAHFNSGGSEYWIPDIPLRYLNEAKRNVNVWVPVIED
ncbi:hypothetical protein SEA_BIRTHDAYBOY_92 [Gordonia phage BirthdayBoy]|uniref:Uncharacterized protein n=1 Tax=Gordonia phage BirthdayBoy TaxID=3077156 RepID=A0AA96K0I8_9CAUD|nr:hypothetical protein SEA_BIRTHDAYBOY_92 [Gordonia phage BirthdayBoy]